MAKQETGLKRNTIDKYYTKDSIVSQCIQHIRKHIKIYENDIIIEPSAGNGAFICGIKSLSKQYKFYDIHPENTEITKQDFLELDYNQLKKNNKNIHIIGNPPFGRQSSLAIKFIKKCCEFANSISFILPKSFKKESMMKHFSDNFHLRFELDLPVNSFLVNGIEMDVPCVFQIWKYMDTPRNKIIKLEPVGFKFVKKSENPDISFRRVGVNAGTITVDIKDKSIQSHYFITFNNRNEIKETINKLKVIKFTEDNTVGPKSISKPELIKEFNKIITI
jgi:predicted RNA methylase